MNTTGPATPAAGTSIATAEALTLAKGTVWERVLAPAGSSLPPPRLLVVLAHPDDEVLALGARLERLYASRLVTVTDGAPKDGADALQHGFESLAAYREQRHAELAAALALAGLSEGVTTPFPFMPVFPDQQAARHLEELTLGLVASLEEFAPEAVLTHPYEGGHPDHDACAFIVHTALRMHRSRTIAAQTEDPRPLLLEAPFYFNNGDGGLRTGTFLHAEQFTSQRLPLSPQERANKQARLACFGSQAGTLGQFGTESESFRLAPLYDFSIPPHEGKLLYECFPWGMTGAHFRTLAAEAEHRLVGGLQKRTTTDPWCSVWASRSPW